MIQAFSPFDDLVIWAVIFQNYLILKKIYQF